MMLFLQRMRKNLRQSRKGKASRVDFERWQLADIQYQLYGSTYRGQYLLLLPHNYRGRPSAQQFVKAVIFLAIEHCIHISRFLPPNQITSHTLEPLSASIPAFLQGLSFFVTISLARLSKDRKHFFLSVLSTVLFVTLTLINREASFFTFKTF